MNKKVLEFTFFRQQTNKKFQHRKRYNEANHARNKTPNICSTTKTEYVPCKVDVNLMVLNCVVYPFIFLNNFQLEIQCVPAKFERSFRTNST